MADFAKIDPIDIPAHEMTPREFALWQKCRELRMEILRLGGSLHPSVMAELMRKGLTQLVNYVYELKD